MGNRWVVVTLPPEKRIIGGPYVWEGDPWEPPEGGGRDASELVTSGEMLEEQDALDDGYTYPPPPPPPDESWVAVDRQALTIVGGPWQWNGTGDPPDPGDLMTESEALASGYTQP